MSLNSKRANRNGQTDPIHRKASRLKMYKNYCARCMQR